MGNGHKITITNRCPNTLYIGILANPGKQLPEQGGFRLDAGHTQFVSVDFGWVGRFWARTGCNFTGETGICETGDCGGFHCAGRGGRPPASLAEIAFDGSGNQAFYDVSLVDGYNVPISFGPASSTVERTQSCGTPTCVHDLLPYCPQALMFNNTRGDVVGCYSACYKFNTDEYCCRGAYNQPSTCNPLNWDTNYCAPFWSACPQAYAYAYDDHRATFTCPAQQMSDFVIRFC